MIKQLIQLIAHRVAPISSELRLVFHQPKMFADQLTSVLQMMARRPVSREGAESSTAAGEQSSRGVLSHFSELVSLWNLWQAQGAAYPCSPQVLWQYCKYRDDGKVGLGWREYCQGLCR